MGAGGLVVPVQGLGCMRMTAPGNPVDESAASAVVNRALDLGVTFLDTADMYGEGLNEEIVGRAVRHRRDEAVIGTKFGAVRDADDNWTIRGDAAYVRTACEASLKRLGVDVIDLYYLARRDPKVPIEESVGAIAELVAEGKVRHVGLSEVTAEELRAAHAVHPITALQSEWSLCSRRVEPVVEVCAELGVGVVPYSPQGRGLLAGGRDSLGHYSAAAFAALIDLLGELARRHGAKPGQVALAWAQHRADVWGIPVVPIPGTTNVDHLECNVGALDIALGADELEALETAAAE
ncbi:aldo/keto reductase [Saccharothrix syringae]|uniref:Aldo/keto reductase n=2 Tax=Saccharothrix syringae TaxID=103733 RepID=A0A5Q0HF89_SACSY|nr:aldo/keto reductase [Saccharothrix syringae]